MIYSSYNTNFFNVNFDYDIEEMHVIIDFWKPQRARCWISSRPPRRWHRLDYVVALGLCCCCCCFFGGKGGGFFRHTDQDYCDEEEEF